MTLFIFLMWLLAAVAFAFVWRNLVPPKSAEDRAVEDAEQAATLRGWADYEEHA